MLRFCLAKMISAKVDGICYFFNANILVMKYILVCFEKTAF